MSPVQWRWWLIDGPAKVTDVGLVWYRLIFMLLLWTAAIGAVVGLITVIVSLVLSFGFGIRWGW